MVKEAEGKAAAQRREWEEESRRRRKEEERARQVKLRQDSRNDLLAAIETWHKVKGVRDWLALVEREIHELGDVECASLAAKLEEAKKLIGDADALEALRKWKAPQERQ